MYVTSEADAACNAKYCQPSCRTYIYANKTKFKMSTTPFPVRNSYGTKA